ncbi:GAF domain-containing sensor histidine kinase [uncultured Friedmanniella sp.]|uniref:GAF domain-containing sensor histidine kinase n=1 Tax=uncultured Friedmanniella sp. TaxID=335381 RepID=UPI0035CB734E
MSSPDSTTGIGTLAAGGQPDLPHLPIETLIAQLVDHASEVAESHHRLRRFHEAYGQIVGELVLSTLLQRIVDVSRDVVGARYAALGVVGADGHFDTFLHSGVDAETAAEIGELPKGRGVLGMMIDHPTTTRRTSITSDPHSCGLPEGHPPMTSFLGVPIFERDRLYAVLYLTDQVSGRPFTAADEELAEALVATASIAIGNAQLYEESRRRQEWLRAAARLSRDLLGSEKDVMTVLERTAAIVHELLHADTVAVLVPDEVDTSLAIVAADGSGSRDLLGLRLPTRNSIAWRAMELGHGLHEDMERVPEGPEAELRMLVPMGAMLILPLRGENHCHGAILTIRRPGVSPFTQADLDMAETFAGQVAVAIQLVEARADQQRLSGMEQRDQIARELNEHVVQRLFAIGLSVEAIAQRVLKEPVRLRLLQNVEDIDETVRQIRSSIFSLVPPGPVMRTLQEVVLGVVEDVAPVLDLDLDLDLDGPLDLPATADLSGDVEAVLRESLTNVRKYARATQVQVRVVTDGCLLEITVADNGIGMQDSARRSGLDNLSRRAERYGGRLSIDNKPKGLTLSWAIPL